MFINSRNFYINDISLDNIIVDLKNRYMDIVFIDSERFSPDNELIQNMVLPEFIFRVFSSGLSPRQFFSPLGQKLCNDIFPPLLNVAFKYSFSNAKDTRKKWLSPDEWLKIIA